MHDRERGMAWKGLQAMIEAHAPECPPAPWTCPECGALIAAGSFFCAHERQDDGDVDSGRTRR